MNNNLNNIKPSLWNNIKRPLIFSACMLAVSFNTFAATPSEIQEKYRTITDLSANFTQSTYIEVLEKTVSESGVFAMKKPGKLRIDYTGANPKMYISDGRKLWVVDPTLEQVEIYKVSNDSIPKEALEFLKGFGEMEKLFTIETFKPKNAKTDHTYLKLTPRSGAATYKSLDCDFGTDNILVSMAIHNKSGNISTYSFNSIRINSGIADDIFTFSKK